MADNVAIQHLSKSFQGFALKDVSFSVPCGAVVGFIGENGAGKSTTLKSILGLINPDGGTISVFGKDCAALSREDKDKIGAVLGETCLPENLTLKDIDGVMKHIFQSWNSEQFFTYTEKFALPADKKVRTFSSGMRQKTSLAVALSHAARLLILDEPTAGLDPIARDEILDVLYDFMQSEERSVLISSHIVSDLEKLCDYIVFIHDGRVVFFEEKDTLAQKYAIFRAPFDDIRALGSAVIAVCRGNFSCSALVLREKIADQRGLEHASIEDIMLYFVRGEQI